MKKVNYFYILISLFIFVIFPLQKTALSKEVKYHKTLSLYAALSEAYKNNPDLLAARESLNAVDENYFQAETGFKPSITGNLSYKSDKSNYSNFSGTNFGDFSGNSKVMSLDINQSLYSGGSTKASVNRAYNKIKAERANLKEREQDIFFDGIQSYMKYIRNQKIYELKLNNEKVLNNHLKASRERYKLGNLTKTDVRQSESRLAGATAERILANSDLKKSRGVFEQIFGISPVGLRTPKINIKLPSNEFEAKEIARINHPLMAKAKYLEDAAKDSIREVEGEYYPKVNLSGSLTRTIDPAFVSADIQNNRSLSVNLTMPFYTGGSTISKVRQSKHKKNKLRMEIYSVRRSINEGVTESWEDLISRKAESKARSVQIKASKLALEGVKVEADFGARTMLDLLDAEQEYLDAQVSYISSETNRIIAVYSLLRSIGRLTAEGLNLDVITYNPAKSFQNKKNRSFTQKTAIFRGDFANIK